VSDGQEPWEYGEQIVMAEDATEEPIEERQEIKRHFDAYADRGVESMGKGE
jgi:hypothetical protein